jgi:DNA-binding XRE family transcriptional regulator
VKLFIEELERVRRERRWSQGEMADAIGINQANYSRLVNGRQGMSIETARAIVQQFPELEPVFLRDIIHQDIELCHEE